MDGSTRRTDGEVHACEGVACPYVVDTGEGLVCAKTGVVVGDVFLASFDHNRCGSRRVNVNVKNPSTEIVATHRTETATAAAASSSLTQSRDDQEDLYGECFRVVNIFVKDEKSGFDKEKLVRRCVDASGMCVAENHNKSSTKVNVRYSCLAALYLMEEGLKIKGTVVCEPCPEIGLPSLNNLTNYGFSKRKYTKAARQLLKTIDSFILSKPLHRLSL